jgi:hypothetical protein
MVKSSALQSVAEFKDFNEDNPHEEHDMARSITATGSSVLK